MCQDELCTATLRHTRYLVASLMVAREYGELILMPYSKSGNTSNGGRRWLSPSRSFIRPRRSLKSLVSAIRSFSRWQRSVTFRKPLSVAKTLWSRKHIDNALADKQPTETVAEEWYSVEDVCQVQYVERGCLSFCIGAEDWQA